MEKLTLFDDCLRREGVRGHEEVAAELAQVEKKLAQYRQEMEKWGRRVELAKKRGDIPEDLRKGASKFYANKQRLVVAGEKYRAYLIVELDQLCIKAREPFYLN